MIVFAYCMVRSVYSCSKEGGDEPIILPATKTILSSFFLYFTESPTYQFRSPNIYQGTEPENVNHRCKYLVSIYENCSVNHQLIINMIPPAHIDSGGRLPIGIPSITYRFNISTIISHHLSAKVFIYTPLLC